MVAPKSITVTRREQRERQRAYRDEQRVLRRPSRDDIARVCLWQIMRRARKAGEHRVNELHEMIVSDLVKQGFDQRQSEELFEDLLDRYSASSTPPFRRKVHLR